MASGLHQPQRLSSRVLATLFLCGSTYLLAHTVNAWVADSLAPPVHSSLSRQAAISLEPGEEATKDASQRFAQDILASGLFVLPAPSSSAVATASTAPPPPPLNVASKVALIGVVTGADGTERAILEDVPSRKQALYRLAQRVADVGELAAIEKDRVLFREGPQEEWLALAIVAQTASAGRFPLAAPQGEAALPAIPAAQQPPIRRSVDRAQLAQLVATPQAYMTEARFQPHFNAGGQIDGFRVDGIRQVGVLEKAGLQNEDVLAGVNGVEIRDPARLWDIFKQLQHERVVRLNVVRQSQPMTWVVEVRG